VISGLFHLLGYQFSPRLADVGESRFWRMDASADYGVLNGLARQTINRNLIEQNWDDLLRLLAPSNWAQSMSPNCCERSGRESSIEPFLFQVICKLVRLKMHWPATHPIP